MSAEAVARRNDPCPCGSGIKFKKCCMTKIETLDNGLLRLLTHEFERLNQGIYTYWQRNFKRSLDTFIKKEIGPYSLSYSARSVVKGFMTIWGIFNHPVRNQKTPFSHFCEQYRVQAERESSIDMVLSWRSSHFSMYTIESISEDRMMAIKDVFSEESLTVPVPKGNSVPNPDSLLVGMVVTILEDHHEFMLGYAEVEASKWTPGKLKALHKQFLSDDALPLAEKLNKNMPEMFILLISDGLLDAEMDQATGRERPEAKANANDAAGGSDTLVQAKPISRKKGAKQTDSQPASKSVPGTARTVGSSAVANELSGAEKQPAAFNRRHEMGNESQNQVVNLLSQQIKGDGHNQRHFQTVVEVWGHYVDAANPSIKKPEAFAAALDYLMGTLDGNRQLTQAEISKQYGVSSSTVSKNYRLLHEFMEERQEKKELQHI